MLRVLLRIYNSGRRALVPGGIVTAASKHLLQLRTLAATPSDINEHLECMFVEALLLQPRLIVELGVRGGTTTAVFEHVAELCRASIVSVDLDDCSRVSANPHWHFFRGDDVYFAQLFPDFCRSKGIVPAIDLLFIDTSHYYEHTVQEIDAWFPLLSARAKVIFHDTNMRLVGPRKDGCVQLSWDNDRGVVRAIEERLGIRIAETEEFTDLSYGWLVRHWPNCNGLTILDRIAADLEKSA